MKRPTQPGSRAMALGLLGRLLVSLLPLLFAPLSSAQVVIRVPLRITIDHQHFDSTRTGMQGHFKFALVDGAGESLWSQDGSSMQGSQPEGHVKLHVTNGIVVVPLGAQSVGMPIDDGSLNTDMPPVKLRVWFGTDPGMFAKLTPDFPLSAVPSVAMALGVPQNAVKNADLANGIVTRAKLANGAVGTATLAANAVDTRHIQDGAVKAQHLVNGFIQGSSFANGVITGGRIQNGGISSNSLPNDVVTTAKLVSGAVTAVDLVPEIVTTAKLVEGAVTSINIGSQQVAGNHFDGAIVSADKFMDASVTTDKLAHNAVTAAKIANSAVGSTHISDDVITGSKLATNVVNQSLSNSGIGLIQGRSGLVTFSDEIPNGQWLELFEQPAYGHRPFVVDLTQTNLNLDGEQRFFPSHNWNGQQWFLWGKGTVAARGEQVAGTRLDKFEEKFHALPTANSPVDRIENVLVWTGRYYVVWGGNNGLTNFNDGAFFDPNTQTWTPMSTAGAPSARSAPAAFAWEGKLGIWGGDNWQDTKLYLFDPTAGANGTWETKTFTDPHKPNAPFEPTWTWTGERLIVWGGRVGVDVVNTGAILDPGNSADHWTPLPTTGAPQPRRQALAAWTGAEMIVWGGIHETNSTETFLSTGGRYNIVQNKWTAISSSAPTYRAGAQAIWTGLEMIVFAPLASGGNAADNNKLYHYNLADDQWYLNNTFASGQVSPLSTATTLAWLGDRLFLYSGNNVSGANYATIPGQSPTLTYFIRP